MSRFLVLQVAVLAALLGGGTAVSAKAKLTGFLTTDVRPMGIGTILQKQAASMLLAGGLLLGAQQLPAQAQGEADVPQVWTDELTQESYNSVFYMTPNQEDSTTLRHVLYIGDTPEGEHIFAGLYMYFLDAWQGDLRLYGSNGQLFADGVERTDIEVFPDPFNDFTVVNLFTIEGLELGEGYTPIMVVPYPIDEFGKELNMVAYGVNEAHPESLFNLVRQQRTCEVTDPKGWGNVGIGMSTCAPPAGIMHSNHGAPIFKSGEMVAFYGEAARAGYVVLQHEAFTEYSSGQQTGATAVSSRGKLSTTWAAIKAGH